MSHRRCSLGTQLYFSGVIKNFFIPIFQRRGVFHATNSSKLPKLGNMLEGKTATKQEGRCTDVSPKPRILTANSFLFGELKRVCNTEKPFLQAFTSITVKNMRTLYSRAI